MVSLTKNYDMLRIERVSFSYSGERMILDEVNLELVPGELHAIVGPNGAGKSTVLKLLCGLLQPTSGSVISDGKAVYVPQRPEDAISANTLEQELVYINELKGASHREALDKARKALQWLGLPDTVLSSRLDQLSYGLKRLAILAEYLSLDFRYLLLDEPTANLSYKVSCKLWQVILKLAEGSIGILYVTHRPWELMLADRISVIVKGKIETLRGLESLLSYCMDSSEEAVKLIGMSLSKYLELISSTLGTHDVGLLREQIRLKLRNLLQIAGDSG